jgi:D-tyrosyl-tRNA(Tyr) deacylase
MRVILQRVLTASVAINGSEKAAIKSGLLLLVGFTEYDTEVDINWMVKKVAQLRIFDDENHIPNLSVQETNGDILSISQFTLFAQTKKGNRPSYIRAAKPEMAEPLYQKFNLELEIFLGKKIFTGSFGADMKIASVNDGPLTIFIDSQQKDF